MLLVLIILTCAFITLQFGRGQTTSTKPRLELSVSIYAQLVLMMIAYTLYSTKTIALIASGKNELY